MKVQLSWLRDYVPVSLSVADLAHKLSMAGDEVEGIERTPPVSGQTWEGIRVAQITAIERHPNADRLSLASIDLGDSTLTLVTGAPNIAVGQRVPFAPVGTRLIDGHTGEMMTLKPAKIRGIESGGMVCSAMELGLGDDHTGILILPDDAPIGAPLVDLLGTVVLDIKTTPNRPDTLSMIGVAWEVAAITGEQVRSPSLDYATAGQAVTEAFTVRIDDPDLCGRYQAGLIRGVTIGPSPEWMQARIASAGMRPINNVVDITNYVMLEYGQPLHAFDAHRIGGNMVVVRRALATETLKTLDGVDRPLDPSMLVIADAINPIALAGVMGGLESEVTETTVDILLESANFHNITIRRTAGALRMRSEASLRFEKGISPAMTEPAIRRAIQLMAELAGGRPAPGLIDVYPGRRDPVSLDLTEDAVERVLGIRWDQDRLGATFRALGFEVAGAPSGALRLTPPYWRTDVTITEDLIEEAARIIGYDELPVTALDGAIPATPPSPLLAAADQARDILVGAGLQEVITYPLVGSELMERTAPAGGWSGPEPLALINPLSAELAVLRTSARPRLIETLAQNQRHQERVAIFEIEPVFLRREDELPEERRIIAAAMAGPRGIVSWLGQPGPVDFFDGKGLVEALLGRFRKTAIYSTVEDPFYQPGRAATVSVDGKIVGSIGEVHPAIVSKLDAREPIVYLEIDLEALLAGGDVVYQPVTRYPVVGQDIAVVVDAAVEAERIRQALLGGKWIREVRLFDVYTGTPLPAGKRSLAFNLRFQAPDRTLTEDEVSRVRTGLVERLRRQFGAEPRG